MKFGIGVITVGKRELDSGYTSYLSQSTTLHIHFDYLRHGPGYGRNECIHTLYEAGCDYIALFDDDCFPYAADWQDYVVGGMQKYNIHHLQIWQYAQHHPTPGSELVFVPDTIGAFSVLTRKTIETIGYYNPHYSKYGWEDVGYVRRVRKSKINGTDKAVSLRTLPKYIKALDVETNPKPGFNGFANMSWDEKQAAIESNRSVFVDELAGPLYIPYQPSVNPHPPMVQKD